MRSPLVQLLTARRFAPLFVTQFLGAFNDNLLKRALGIVVTFRLAQQTGLGAASLVMLAGALFIAPFFLFSGASGTLADRIDKSSIARVVKIAEIGIMNRGSSVASSTTTRSRSRMACAQKDTSRGVSPSRTPMRDLNHWRCSSTSVIDAIGVSQMPAASRVRSSNDCSVSVSST